MIEGQDLALALLAVREERHADAVLPLRLGEGVMPDLEAEVLRPAVEALPLAIGVQHRGGEAPVAERERAFERALPGVVGFHMQVAESAAQLANLVAQQPLLPLRLPERDHRLPLEGSERLGAEGGDADVDLRPGVQLLSPAQGLCAERDDGLDVLVALGGQPDHEVELHQVPAG